MVIIAAHASVCGGVRGGVEGRKRYRETQRQKREWKEREGRDWNVDQGAGWCQVTHTMFLFRGESEAILLLHQLTRPAGPLWDARSASWSRPAILIPAGSNLCHL